MRIQLPNGDRISLDRNISLNDKKNIVNKMIEEWQNEIIDNWDGNAIKFFLDGLSNYLVWHKEDDEKGKEDKEVLSTRKIEEMIGKRKGKSIPFANLTTIQKESLFSEKGVVE